MKPNIPLFLSLMLCVPIAAFVLFALKAWDGQLKDQQETRAHAVFQVKQRLNHYYPPEEQ